MKSIARESCFHVKTTGILRFEPKKVLNSPGDEQPLYILPVGKR